ncbi:MAG: hypothetical protein GY832_27400 [Chloroflexi bacterium]|nr:hypothetical protein [Chloroflexota bacterium]
MNASNNKLKVDIPIVIERKKKKRKKKYSQGFEDIQIMERNLTRASHRTVQAIDKGMDTYRKARNKSARKKRDGAIVDLAPNIAKSAGKTLRTASVLPYDLIRASYPKTARRLVRGQIRFVSRLLRDI